MLKQEGKKENQSQRFKPRKIKSATFNPHPSVSGLLFVFLNDVDNDLKSVSCLCFDEHFLKNTNILESWGISVKSTHLHLCRNYLSQVMVAMGPKLIYLATKRNSVSHFKEQEWHCCIHCLYGETSHTESFQNVSNIAKSAWNSWGMLWLCYCYIANTSWFEQEWVSWELRNLYCWCACPTLCWKNLLEKGVTLLPKHRQEAINFLFLLLHASTRWWWRKLYAITAYSKGLALGFVLPAISQSLSLGADPFQSCSLLPVLFIFMHQIWCRV